MQKKKLEQIEPVPTPKQVQELSGRIKLASDYVATCRYVLGKKILEVSLYYSRDAAKKQVMPKYRMFLAKDDFLTEELEQIHGVHIKWMTAGYERCDISFIRSTCEYNKETHKYDYSRIDNVVMASKKAEAVLRNFLQYHDDESVWIGYREYTEKIQKSRRDRKYDKERAKIDSELADYKKIPANVVKWGWNHVMDFSQYGVFDKISNKLIKLNCTCCGASTILDQKKEGIKWKGTGKCPACKKKITYIPRGRTKSWFRDSRWMCYIDPAGGNTCMRYFLYERTYRKGKLSHEDITEYARSIVHEWNGPETKEKEYEFREFHDRGVQWNYSINKIPCGMAVLYPGNLPKAWENTPMKYSAIEQLGKRGHNFCVERLMGRYLRYPKIEWLIKMKLDALAVECSYNYPPIVDNFDFEAETIYKILGLDKPKTKILCEVNGDSDVLRILQKAHQTGKSISKVQLQESMKILNSKAEDFWSSEWLSTYHKQVSYIKKQAEANMTGYAAVYDLWKDYKRFGRAIGLDMHDTYYLFPKNLKESHDWALKEFMKSEDARKKAERIKMEREAKKKLKEAKKIMDKILDESKGKNPLNMKAAGLMIVVPSSAQQIKNEGTFLHHCVGSYVDKVARGETMILFIRKIEEPDTPYYTMEYKDGKVVQCYGMRNCKTTAEVQGLVDAFEKKMQMAS